MSCFIPKPVVCAVGTDYMIMIPVTHESLVRVKVGDEFYYNHSNGIRRSVCKVQSIAVPGEVLNREKKYTVYYSKVIKRMDYSCFKEEEKTFEFSFRPVEKTSGINIYHLSDCHGINLPAVKAGGFFGDDLDILILNGDISSRSCSVNDIMLSYKIAYGITKGTIPVIISRGNHDLRGRYAEKLEELMPSDRGLSYYNVRLGNVWMSLVDCGEDKDDNHAEYGGTAAYHSMRLAETRFLEKTVSNAANEYEADGVKYKFIVSHVPFTAKNDSECKGERPFNIENEIYDKWTEIIKTSVKPDFLLAGHYHRAEVWHTGGEMDHRNAPFDVIIGSIPAGPKSMTGAAITLEDGFATVKFTDENKNIVSEEQVVFPKY